MTPSEILLIRLRKELEMELEALSQLILEYQNLPRVPGAPYLLRAKGSIFHDFYTGVERVLLKIAQELNGGPPRSEQWHKDLLLDMTLELEEVRPAIITRRLHDRLVPFLRFRHLFRNFYGFLLDEEKLKSLEEVFIPTFKQFQDEISAFIIWLKKQT